jgi:hypothetical protein
MLVDSCPECHAVTRSTKPASRCIVDIGKCHECGFELNAAGFLDMHEDKLGILIQRKLQETLSNTSNYNISARKTITQKEYLKALQIIYRLISKLKIENSLVRKECLTDIQLRGISMYFNSRTFTTKLGQPSMKIDNVLFNYIVFNSAYLILSKWPVSFYQLLDELFKIYANEESLTKNRVFGLLQKTHMLIINEAPEYMKKSYYQWIRSKSKDYQYFFGKEFCADSHLYRYSDIIYTRKSEIYINSLPLYLKDKRWTKVKDIFRFPDKHIGSGNIYKRAERSAQLFCSAYLYKLNTGCSWAETPAVLSGLIKSGGIYQIISKLRKKGVFKVITQRLLNLEY